MVTIKEIARECQVSPTTVSNILNGKTNVSEATRQRVLAVVKKRGYQPNAIARGLRNQKTRTIGILVEDLVQFSTARIVDGIMERCERQGYRTIVQNLRLYSRWSDTWYENEEAYRSMLEPALQQILQMQADGMIYVAGHERLIRCFSEEFPIPAVMAYGYDRTGKVPSVVPDDEKGGYEITRYLISMGHQRIGVIGGRADNIHTAKRLMGYQRALYEHQLPFSPELVRYGNWKRDDASRLLPQLLCQGVTAVFCMADQMAGGVYDYLDAQGKKAGADLSVAGFDNQEMAGYFRPGLTTMELPLWQIGQTAAGQLLARLEGKDGETAGCVEQLEIKIPCRLVERGSVRRVE